MKCTVVLTERTDGNIHVTVPGFPECTVEASTRDEALRKIRGTINSVVSRSEILQLDVSSEPKSTGSQFGTPWEFFGAFVNNPEWGDIFDEIEQQKNHGDSL